MSTAALAIENKTSIYQSIVVSLLEKMPLGKLHLTLPNGQTLKIGNGVGFHADLSINNPIFFKKCVLYGDVGFGESYVDGDWNTSNITNVISWFLYNVEHSPTISGSKMKSWTVNLFNFFNKIYHFTRANTIEGSRKNISEHYDLSNDFYHLWLDKTMTYSSAYFKSPDESLEQAQYNKYDRLCQQLRLNENDHVLEIGSGWGGMSIHMAKNYGCKVSTVTISQEQFNYAKKRIEEEGLSHKIDIQIQDYRLIDGTFDKIVSIEMLEAVGHKFLDVYFRKCQELLKKDGLFAFQVITSPDSRYDSLRKGVDWIQKHIFPGSLLPSVKAINSSINRTGDMTLIDVKDLGKDYALTLNMWQKKFNSAINEVKSLGFDDRFSRKWNYYLSYCEAAFDLRNINVLQLVYTRPNNYSFAK